MRACRVSLDLLGECDVTRNSGRSGQEVEVPLRDLTKLAVFTALSGRGICLSKAYMLTLYVSCLCPRRRRKAGRKTCHGRNAGTQQRHRGLTAGRRIKCLFQQKLVGSPTRIRTSAIRLSRASLRREIVTYEYRTGIRYQGVPVLMGIARFKSHIKTFERTEFLMEDTCI